VTKYPLHDKALAYAISQLGVHEQPFGSNRGPIQRQLPKGGVDYYQQHDFLAGVGYPWCVTLWLTAWAEGANHPLPYKTAGAYAMLQWARGAGWAKPSTELTPGDGVVFNIGSGHLAMFEKWVGSTIHTIDGNTSNMVARRARAHSLVAGGIHVPEKVYVPPKPVPKPFWVITGDENGRKVLVFSEFATEKTIVGMLPRLFARFGAHGVTIKKGGEKK
jgi:CHAP domain-containing protein